MVRSDLWGDAMAYKRQARPGFMVLHESGELLRFLTDEQKGQVWDALFRFSQNGTDANFADNATAMAYAKMRQDVQRYAENYNQRCEMNRQNRNKASNDNGRWSTIVEDGDQYNENIKENINIPPISPKGDCEDLFDTFWSEYPKKKGKPKAKEAFDKAIKKTDLDTMLKAIQAQSLSPEWQKENGQFIPYPSSWLNGCRWEDEVTQAAPAAYIPLPDNIPDNGW